MRTKLTFFVPSVKRLFRNAAFDLRYGAFLGGTVSTPYASLGIHDTASTDYEALPEIFSNTILPSDVLVDIGCGKGRVINWWLSRGWNNQIIGIELDPEIARETARRLQRHRNVKIIWGDALAQLPENGSIFYLFNPFNEVWVAAFKDRVATLVQSGNRARIFYYNCVHVHTFKNDPRWIVDEIEMRYPFHRLALIKPAIKMDCPLCR